jgi:hypothetical protein
MTQLRTYVNYRLKSVYNESPKNTSRMDVRFACIRNGAFKATETGLILLDTDPGRKSVKLQFTLPQYDENQVELKSGIKKIYILM